MKKKLEGEYAQLEESRRQFEKEKADFEALQARLAEDKKSEKSV